MTQEEAAKVSSRHSKGDGQVLDRLAVVEKAALDQPEGPRHGCTGSAPRRRPRCGLRATAKTWTEACALGGGRRGKEYDVPGLGRLDRTDGPAIDPSGQNAGKEAAIEAPVARQPRTITCPPVESQSSRHNSSSLARESLPPLAARRLRPETARRH